MFYPVEEKRTNVQIKVRFVDQLKASWDIFVMIVLIFSCLTIPYRVAFVKEDTKQWEVVNNTVDICFLLDIIIIFNSAYYDEDFKIVDSRKTISCVYLKGWFFIDIVSILPIEMVLKADAVKYNEMIRIARIGRIYKVVKLFRLVRIVKFAKSKNRFVLFILRMFSLSGSIGRIFLFLAGFFLTCHIVCCLWTICAQMSVNIEDTWLSDYEDDRLYLTSYYFIVTTITTVGYGDISGGTPGEQIFCIIIMVVGVISFSFASGSLASIMQNYDSKNAVYNEKMKKLKKIYEDYNIPYDLYGKMKTSI